MPFVGVGTGHAVRVGIDDVEHAEVRLEQCHRERHRLAGGVLVDVVSGSAGSTFVAGQTGDHAAQGDVGDHGQILHLARLAEDRSQRGGQRGIRDGGRQDRRGRRAVFFRHRVGGLCCNLHPLAEAAGGVWSASTVLGRHLVGRADGGFHVALQLADGLGLGSGAVGRRCGGDGILQGRDEPWLAENLAVVAETRTRCELVVEAGNVLTFGNTGGGNAVELVGGPFVERGRCLAFRAERQERSFLRGEHGKFVGEILTVANGGTLASGGGGCVRVICG